ncbi:MAG: hypothetical protein HQL52_17730 [Magnetococcales bacterium]|nr:hypothetical protein [Magnetococcales bacterium]
MAASQLFLQRLASLPRGQIVLCNLVSAVQDGLIPSGMARSLLAWWEALHRWMNRPGGTGMTGNEEEDLLNCLLILLTQKQAPGFQPARTKPDFRLRCQHVASSGSAYPSVFFTVKKVDPFVRFLLHDDDKERLAGENHISVDAIHRRLMVSGVQTIRLSDDGFLANPEGLLWVSPDPPPTGAGAADRARDVLGLIDNGSGDALLAVHLPSRAVINGRGKRPTVGDGGNDRFRIRADHSSHRTQAHWGFTVDLEALARGNGALDGYREWVCESLPTSDVGGRVKIEPLGVVANTRGQAIEDNHPAFAGRVCGGVSNNQAVILQHVSNF